MHKPFIEQTLLWLLAHLREESTTITLVQMLESPAIQVEQALAGLSAQDLIDQHAETQCWTLTPSGKMRLRQGLPEFLAYKQDFFFTNLIATWEEEAHEPVCALCTERMRALLHKVDTAGSVGFLELLLVRLHLWKEKEMEPAEAQAFTGYAFAAHDVALYLMKQLAQSSACMAKAVDYATRMGDKRTLLLLQFARGCSLFFSGMINFEQADTELQVAMELLNRLDDKELYTRATPFLILVHFIKGNFQQVLEWYELLQKSRYKPVLPFMDSQLILQASSSAAYMGHFAQAMGMLKSAISQADITGQGMSGLLCRQHMGILLAYMHRRKEAEDALQTVIARSTLAVNPKLMLRAFAALALCHAQKGEVEDSYRLFSSVLKRVQRHVSFSLSYNYLWILELAVVYETRGFPALPGIDPDTLFGNAAKSPSSMIRGHALRCQALRRLHHGEAPETILELLDASLALLEKARTPVECGLTQEKRAMVLRGMGQEDKAKEAEENARILFNGRIPVKEPLFGSDASSPVGADPPTALLDRCYDELSAFYEWDTLEECAYQLAACLRKLFHAERSALFQLNGTTLSCPGACNLSRYEILGEAFAPNRALIKERMLQELPFAARQDGLDIICIAFHLFDGTPWLLYADSAAPSSRIPHCLPEELRTIGRFFAVELRNAIRFLNTKKLNAKVRQIQAVNRLSQKGTLEIIGKNEAFRRCLARANVVATTDAAVLLLGETGVGKEVMASYIHRKSGCKGPFVAVHPASISEHLFENEFFGHEKGAFTGAVGQKIGLFELADNGTLFIDEVGDVPLNMQIKLLRVLQERTFMRVGGTREIRSSFRLITATNRDLPRAVREGTFREDLYYRISVIPLTIPPLRTRLDDLEELVVAFLDYFSKRYNKKIAYPDEDFFLRLRAYSWPGNIRELRNAVERAVILHTGGPLDLMTGTTAPEYQADSGASETSLYADLPTLEELQQRYIRHVLQKTKGRVCGPNGAERILGMKRSTLYLKLRQYGIHTRDFLKPEKTDKTLFSQEGKG